MVLTPATDPTPLARNADGVVLVRGTRVTLDTVVTAFQQGATAEEIATRYPALRLADVYGTIHFYLNHREEVAAYLRQRDDVGAAIRQENEMRFGQRAWRDRLPRRAGRQ
ncbi:hypothetical protein KR51_00020800 [Rubidibacter lacunae KORDI 51-2]|uniref:DUF433 domain-containing protein n=1 Tax=Rubidibacter lacunae KORDI 51-2 TaxID=582515 RepID=U5DIK7_9CHRO|nr:DUF433 domain-containing protein [Rubidibacter lacunae]ERN41501.1 hypothetical protein KR51_00020800 [Rubidibacter lacunae KORDI 51-2]